MILDSSNIKRCITYAKEFITLDNAKEIYNIYIESIVKKFCMECGYMYLSSNSVDDTIFKLNYISSSPDGKADTTIMDRILNIDNDFYQPIWSYKLDDKIIIFDGVQRFMSIKYNSKDILAVILDMKQLNSKYIDLLVPSIVIDDSDGLIKRSNNQNTNIVNLGLSDNFNLYEVKVKGFSALMTIITYWSKYIDVVYDMQLNNEDLNIIPAEFIGNRMDFL